IGIQGGSAHPQGAGRFVSGQPRLHIDRQINIDITIQWQYGGDMVNSGLEGIVAAATRLSNVEGERGEMRIAGYPVGEIAPRATFEEMTWLLWRGNLPSGAQLDGFRSELASARYLPPATLALLRDAAIARLDTMDALRIAASAISLVADDGGAIV